MTWYSYEQEIYTISKGLLEIHMTFSTLTFQHLVSCWNHCAVGGDQILELLQDLFYWDVGNVALDQGHSGYTHFQVQVRQKDQTHILMAVSEVDTQSEHYKWEDFCKNKTNTLAYIIII